ncbi:MAG: tetraacyldisaccharide 4'-kinase [Nitrospirae bacterium]|nr:tetraacyldisaccharide 4'-kinase [Nitrospirota bacterium]
MGLLSGIYGIVLKIARLLKKPKKLPCKVISIGNITLGGTGKTPAVMALAEEAKRRGYKPCILTRGYKGKAKDPCFVTKGEKPLMNASQAGDEAFLMAEALSGVPIIKCADRYEGGIFTLNSQLKILNSKLVFILDDGFQHWQLHRDRDILLIDATNPFDNGKLFPEGKLREPLSALKRADIIVLSKADMADKKRVTACISKIKRYSTDVPIYTSSHVPAALINVSGESESIDTLKERRVYAFSGIANPYHFEALLKSMGAEIVKSKRFRDHHHYPQGDIDKMIKEAGGMDIITTEKDMVKLKGLRLPENIFALRIKFLIDGNFYDGIFGI